LVQISASIWETQRSNSAFCGEQFSGQGQAPQPCPESLHELRVCIATSPQFIIASSCCNLQLRTLLSAFERESCGNTEILIDSQIDSQFSTSNGPTPPLISPHHMDPQGSGNDQHQNPNDTVADQPLSSSKPPLYTRKSGQHSHLAKTTLLKTFAQGDSHRLALSAPATPQHFVSDSGGYFPLLAPLPLGDDCPSSMSSKTDADKSSSQNLYAQRLSRNGVGPAASDTPLPSTPSSPGM
jgi:hypothetical protein